MDSRSSTAVFTKSGAVSEHPLGSHSRTATKSLGPASTHNLGQRPPSLLIRKFDLSEILIQVENDLQRIATARERARVEATLHRRYRIRYASLHLVLLGLAGIGNDGLEHFVRGESETELGGRSEDSCRTALEEGREALLFPDGLGSVSQAVVGRLTLSGLNLETGLDDVARSGQVRSGHTGNGTSCQELNNTELVGGRLAEEVLLEMAVGGEVNGGERNITKQASRSALVKTDETQIANNPHSRSLRSTTNSLGDLALDLETNLDNFERVGEDLDFVSRENNVRNSGRTYDLATTGGTTSNHLADERNVAILIGQPFTSQIVHCELDGLLGSNTDELG